MSVLDAVESPAQLRALPPDDLPELADDLRQFLVDHVCRQGGHLGPNLGVVELTVALHRVFDSPRDPIVFDTGHQAYVHKILTGRRDSFASLRTRGGLSGYPNQSESPHDLVENSHASTALAYADGLSRVPPATTSVTTEERPRTVVAVVGDGALTGGMAWEALNNLGRSGRPVVVVLNDNGRSYAPTVGALPHHLRRLADRAGYGEVQQALGGGSEREAAVPEHATCENLFRLLGFSYLGPVDGHDIGALESAFRRAADSGGPAVVHCRTRKGHGYRPAEVDEADRMHAVGVIDPATGSPVKAASRTWTDVFADALVDAGARRADVVAVTAAMAGPTGLRRFADRFPDRCHDVGIAEQHAVTSAAGMALGGLHPVVALYATFANRAFDQTLLDVALHGLPVTFVLDRAGITGPDGASHHGLWDLALFSAVPGLQVAAPRDADTLVEELEEAVATTGPTCLRFPKAAVAEPVPACRRVGRVDVLHEGCDALVVAVGPMAAPAVEAARILESGTCSVTVVDPRWVLPVRDELVSLAEEHRVVVTVEDGLRTGGVGSHLASALADRGATTVVRRLGVPTSFLGHGSRQELLDEHGLTADGIREALEGLLPASRWRASLAVIGRRGESRRWLRGSVG